MKSNKSKQKKNKKNKKNKNKKEGQTEKKRGRPTKYRPEFCQMMVEWFDRELTEIVECERATSNGAVVTIKEEKPIRPPMFGESQEKF